MRPTGRKLAAARIAPGTSVPVMGVVPHQKEVLSALDNPFVPSIVAPVCVMAVAESVVTNSPGDTADVVKFKTLPGYHMPFA